MKRLALVLVTGFLFTACSLKSTNAIPSGTGTGPSGPKGTGGPGDNGKQTGILERQFVQLSELAGVVCGLESDGHVLCWGTTYEQDFLKASGPRTLTSFQSISGLCGITADHQAYCWDGDGRSKWRGEGVAVSSSQDYSSCLIHADHTPDCTTLNGVTIPPGLRVKTIINNTYSAQNAACYVGMDDVLGCLNLTLPDDFQNLKVRSIQGNDGIICALTMTNDVKCYNAWDKSGMNMHFDQPVTSIGTSMQRVCAVLTNKQGQCYDFSNDFFTRRGYYYPFPGESMAQMLSNGCGLTIDHRVLCDPKIVGTNIPYLTPPMNLGVITDFGAAQTYGCRLAQSGTVSCFINSTAGFDINSSEDPGPWAIEKDGPMKAISVATSYACGVHQHGDVVCEGHIPDALAARLKFLVSVKRIWLTADSACWVDEADTFACAGHLAGLVPDGTRNIREVALSGNTLCAVDSNQKLRCYGDVGSFAGYQGPVNRVLTDEGDDYCVLDAGGNNWCFGKHINEGPVPNPNINVELNVDGVPMVAMKTAAGSVCGLNASGDLYCRYKQGLPVVLIRN